MGVVLAEIAAPPVIAGGAGARGVFPLRFGR